VRLKGRAWKFGDNVDTDTIIPGKYLHLTNIKEAASHAMEGLDPSFTSKIEKGDMIVAGRNFGCGSSREMAAAVLKELGIGAVIAVSFARIFFRNAINLGLPAIECPDTKEIMERDLIEVDLTSGEIVGERFNIIKTSRLPEFMLEILRSGGLVQAKRQQRGRS
jgi:3-isopropylmalate dehydratase small subunit